MTTDTSDAEFTGSGVEITTDAIFETLLDVRRRYTLYYLLEANGTVSLERLVDWIARREGRTSPDDRERVLADLHHRHLPALADRGVVRYEPIARTVDRLPAADRLEPYLDLSRTADC